MSKLNFTTRVSAERSAAEIQSLLVKAGARAIMTDFKDGQLHSLVFRLDLKEGQQVCIKVPVNVEGTYALLCHHRMPKSKRNMDYARRVAWRVAKDWVEAQLAYIAAKQATVGQLFLPHVINQQTGQTLYEQFTQQPANSFIVRYDEPAQLGS